MPFAPFPGRLDERHLDLDLLSLGHAKVFVQFDGLAVNLAVNRFRHGGFLRRGVLEGNRDVAHVLPGVLLQLQVPVRSIGRVLRLIDGSIVGESSFALAIHKALLRMRLQRPAFCRSD